MRAVLVFCEGTTDVVFVERSLGACANCRRIERPIRELPSPFGASDSVPKGLIANRLAGLAVEDLALRDDYPPTPQFESIVEQGTQDVMFVLIRVGGKSKAAAALKLAGDVDALMQAGDFEVTEHAAAFLFDADEEGLNATVSNFRKSYEPYYGDLSGVAHAQWTATTSIPVGLYVFHDGRKETGTLEDHVAPMVESEWPARYSAAHAYIEQNSGPDDAVSKNESRRLKATITAAGQFDHPGRPLATVLARKGLPDQQYQRSTAANALASFLLSTPWPGTRGGSQPTSRRGG